MLKDMIDWENVMAAPRYAGGHGDVMEALFKDASVLVSASEQDYQGEQGYVYKLADGYLALVTDYFGSCSGCDAYEDATDDDIRSLVTALANNAHTFASLAELKTFLATDAKPQGDAVYYRYWNTSAELLKALETAPEL